jgi:hypothetical protein
MIASRRYELPRLAYAVNDCSQPIASPRRRRRLFAYDIADTLLMIFSLFTFASRHFSDDSAAP